MKQTIAIEDEPLALQLVTGYIQKTPFLQFLGGFDNPLSAMEYHENHPVELVFLDIQMPGESGFDLLDKIPSKVKVIFVTAFDEYALRAFEVNAVDYLMKPVTHVRLKSCIERLLRKKRFLIIRKC